MSSEAVAALVGWITPHRSTERRRGGCKKRHPPYKTDFKRIAQTVANWRGEPLDVGGEIAEYQDIAGFCLSVTLAEIAEHGHVLKPGRYVAAEEVEDDDEAFAEKMQPLTQQLGEQMQKGAELDQLIRLKLGGLGYEC